MISIRNREERSIYAETFITITYYFKLISYYTRNSLVQIIKNKLGKMFNLIKTAKQQKIMC